MTNSSIELQLIKKLALTDFQRYLQQIQNKIFVKRF